MVTPMLRSFNPALYFTTAILLATPPALGAEGKTSQNSDTQATSGVNVDELVSMLKEQRDLLAKQEKELQSQKERVHFLSSQVSSLLNERNLSKLEPAAGPASSSPEVTNVKEVPVATPKQQISAGAATGDTPQQVGLERKPVDRDRPPKIEAVGNSGGVLLRPGQAVLESATEYSRSSAVRVAIEGFTIIPALNIGAFEISQVDRDTFVESITGRAGVFENFEVEARVPYVYRNDNTLARPLGTGSSADELSNITGDGLGDVEVAARYQFMQAHGDWPFLIANLRYKSDTGESPFEVPIDPDTGLQTELPTGSGFTAIQPSITAIMPSDPVVLYSTIGYLYNMSKGVDGLGDVDPGDSISASFGMGFSLNEKTSFSLGYAHDYVFETTIDEQDVPNSDKLHVGRLLTGFGYRVSDATSLNLNVDAGLTDDAPDVRVTFRVPMYFNLF